MKTEIELFDVTQTRNTVTAKYCVYDAETEANVKQQISKSVLLNHVEENMMNVIELLNLYDMEYNSVELDAETYLADNLNGVVKDYLTANLQEAA